MRWAGTLTAALLAEAAAHFLSLSWGFGMLILAFVVTGLRAQAATAKSADTEKRVNGLVTSVGAVKDTADYASGRADTAYTNAATAQSTANSAQTTANNALAKAGGTITGTLDVDGDITGWSDLGIHGGGTCVGNWAVGTLKVNGTQLYLPRPDLALVSTPPNGSGSPSQYCGSFYTGSGAANWSAEITTKVNSIVGTLRDANLIV